VIDRAVWQVLRSVNAFVSIVRAFEYFLAVFVELNSITFFFAIVKEAGKLELAVA
jgi:hypothetical protein